MGQEDLPETVVLSPGGYPGGRSNPAARTSLPDNQTNLRQQPGGDNIHPQTTGAEKKEDSPQDDDILTETVILRPGKDKGLQDE